MKHSITSRVVHRSHPLRLPLVAMGFVFIAIGIGGTFIPLAAINFSAGPVSTSVSGISPFSALSSFIGIVLIILGLVL